jgi:hypothetical protein
MTIRKKRLTVTVDPGLIEEGSRAVADGEADSLSGWVSTALSEKVNRDRKLQQLQAAIADYETEFGEITVAEMADQRRADREAAVIVRGPKPSTVSQPRRKKSARSA